MAPKTDVIEQLRARIAELEEEKKELQALLDFDNARLDQIEDELEDVEYLGPFVEGIKVLKTQLAAAQDLISTLRKEAETYGPEKISIQKQAWLEADRQRQINELKDQLCSAEQRVAEWQPIETAPKDGTVVIVWWWNKVITAWCAGAGLSRDGGDWWRSHAMEVVSTDYPRPTHWMPLPKPPAIDAAMGDK